MPTWRRMPIRRENASWPATSGSSATSSASTPRSSITSARRSRGAADPAPARATSTTSSALSRPQPARARRDAADVRHRPAREHRLRVDPARSIRASSTRPARRSRRTRRCSIPRTSSSSRSRAAATPSRRRTACSGSMARKYAHKIPFIVKINHNELLSATRTRTTRRCSATSASASTWARSRHRRDGLLGRARVAPPAPRDRRGVRRGARARHVHGAVVLRPQQRVQDRRRRSRA